MIQRIQSLYLLLAAVAMAMMVFFPLGWIIAGGEEYRLLAFGLETAPQEGIVQQVSSTMGLGIIVCVAALLPFVTIFLFKNRMLQFRLCMAEFALLLGAQAMALLFLYRLAGIFTKEFEMEAAVSLGLPMFLPVVAAILNWLALRGIKKDIILIKSLNRIR